MHWIFVETIAVRILVCFGVYALMSISAYLLIPLVARQIIRWVLAPAYERFLEHTQQNIQSSFQQHRDSILPGSSARIIGHLVDPYLERLGSWTVKTADRLSHERVVGSATDLCLKRVLRWRLILALATGEMVLVLMALGYLARGVI